MKQVCFSVITACYNTEKYVRECVESVLRQDYPPDAFELVCVDDGSTDRSTDILRSFEGMPNFVLKRTENRGLEAACNLGISTARYDRVVRLDADDTLDPQFLRVMARAIDQWSSEDFYYCKGYVDLYADGTSRPRTLPEYDAEEVFSRGDFFATGTVYKKNDFESAGRYDERVRNCGLENYNLILRLISKGKKGRAVPGASFHYRRHTENMSLVKRDAIIRYGRELLASFGREFRTNEFHPYQLTINPGAAAGRPSARGVQ